MSLTPANIVSRVGKTLGDESTTTATFLYTSLNNMLFYLYDLHDWEYRHKVGTFNTVVGTESYNLSSVSADLRTAQALEIVYNTTLGRVLNKVDLQQIRTAYPKIDQNGQPSNYAPWGSKTIYLDKKPDAIYTINFLYVAKPTLPTTNDDDLETVCGLPDYAQYLLEKLVLKEGMLYYDDNRYAAFTQEIESVMIPRAIQADMAHLEESARFKFWQEKISGSASTYDQYLSHAWSNSNY